MYSFYQGLGEEKWGEGEERVACRSSGSCKSLFPLHCTFIFYPPEEPSKGIDSSKECLVSESNAGELLLVAGSCSTKVKASSPEEDSCSLSLKEKPGSTQGLDTDSAALDQLSTDLETRSRYQEMNEEPPDLIARGTTPTTAYSTPALLHSEHSMANTTGEP